MASKRQSEWNRMLSGMVPRGSGSLEQVQAFLWKSIRKCQASQEQAMLMGDTDVFIRLLNSAGLLSNAYANVYTKQLEMDLNTKLDALIAQRLNGKSAHTISLDEWSMR